MPPLPASRPADIPACPPHPEPPPNPHHRPAEHPPPEPPSSQTTSNKPRKRQDPARSIRSDGISSSAPELTREQSPGAGGGFKGWGPLFRHPHRVGRRAAGEQQGGGGEPGREGTRHGCGAVGGRLAMTAGAVVVAGLGKAGRRESGAEKTRLAERARLAAPVDGRDLEDGRPPVRGVGTKLCRRDGCTDVKRVGGACDLGADVTGMLSDGRRLVVQCKRADVAGPAPHP